MLFISCEMLVQELLIAKRDLKLSRLIKKYSRYEGMIIDDLARTVDAPLLRNLLAKFLASLSHHCSIAYMSFRSEMRAAVAREITKIPRASCREVLR
jgi:hypothetical protein